MSNVVDVFKVYRSKRSNEIYKYEDLSNHFFTSNEKEWVCKGLFVELEGDSHWKNIEVDHKLPSAKCYFAQLFEINYKTMMK